VPNPENIKSSEDISKLEDEFTNFFEDLMYDRGGSPLLGRIYSRALLSVPDKPLFQKDLVSWFEVNPSTISRNLKELENWNLISKRRKPGSREWKYQVEDTSFFELLVHNVEENGLNLRDRLDDLKRIQKHWAEALSDSSKESDKGKRIITVLNRLIEWTEIVEKELNAFTQKLHALYLDLEKKYEE
jgi:DNA-binding transcriptional regulator GbsR (MarR family)